MGKSNPTVKSNILKKVPTGIKGLDELTYGGLPKGRPTLICGNAGCGKTLLAMEFLIKGATLYNEPGVFMSFEETESELITNTASLGFDLSELIKNGKIFIDQVYIERSEIEVTGEYDLEALFIRLNYAIDKIGAKRVVLDTIESLFSGLPNPLFLRSELRRLFRWLKEKGVTAIITGESGENAFTRQGIEEFVTDCVIVLDHRVIEQTSTRRMRVVKYRGSTHATNEFPFLIDETGFTVLPITSIALDYSVSTERISSGIPRLDTMMGGEGYFRGSSILVSGTAGSGKSSMAACFTIAGCQRGEKVLYFSMEESPDQIVRNMKSVGLNLDPWMKKGLVQFHSIRPTFYGLEMHLSTILKLINQFNPRSVVVDPVNSFIIGSNQFDAKQMLIRLIDFLKSRQITGFFTNLTAAGTALEHTDIAISSSIDTWLLLRDIELGGERNRGMFVLKSRGMSHSNQIREFVLSEKGVELLDVYMGKEGVLTGSARISQELRDAREIVVTELELERRKQELKNVKAALNAQVNLLQAEYETASAGILRSIAQEEAKLKQFDSEKSAMSKSRKADIVARQVRSNPRTKNRNNETS